MSIPSIHPKLLMLKDSCLTFPQVRVCVHFSMLHFWKKFLDCECVCVHVFRQSDLLSPTLNYWPSHAITLSIANIATVPSPWHIPIFMRIIWFIYHVVHVTAIGDVIQFNKLSSNYFLLFSFIEIISTRNFGCNNKL